MKIIQFFLYNLSAIGIIFFSQEYDGLYNLTHLLLLLYVLAFIGLLIADETKTKELCDKQLSSNYKVFYYINIIFDITQVLLCFYCGYFVLGSVTTVFSFLTINLSSEHLKEKGKQ